MTGNDITRESASISVGEFTARFLAPEVPVILEGVPIGAEASARAQKRALLDEIEAHEMKHARRSVVRHSPGWLDVTPEGICDGLGIPEAFEQVDRLVPKSDVHIRDTSVRLWGSRSGNITPWHNDGNSVSGLNLQVVGRKHWQIVSPRTPMLAYPLMCGLVQGSTPLNQRQTETFDWMGFDTRPGDMLYLPRYWAHSVVSLDEWNVNVNVVFTPRNAATSPVAERESGRRATVQLLTRSPLWRFVPDSVKGFAVDDDYSPDSTRGTYQVSDYLANLRQDVRSLPILLSALRHGKDLGLL